MKLNKNNWFARYYNWIYGEYANDVCSFFWGTVFAIIFSFICVPGRLLAYLFDGKPYSNGILFWLGYLAAFIIGISCYSKWIEVEELSFEDLTVFGGWGFAVFPLIGLIASALVVAFGGGFVALLIYLSERDKPTLVQNTSDWVGAIRKKHCTKINWY
jgi:hypothetical protein